MSLVIANYFQENLAISADTRAVSTVDGPLPDPVEKIRVWDVDGHPLVVAVAGETIIDGIHVFDHVYKLRTSLTAPEGRHALVAYLMEAWERDFRAAQWDSQEELNDYLGEARINILIASAMDALHIIDGGFRELELMDYIPPRPILAFGKLTGVERQLESYDGADWLRFVANTFDAASCASLYVAPPIDILVWRRHGRPTISRFQTIGEMLKHA